MRGGNSIILIEHNLDVIKCSDWLIDLGPEGGDRGGTLVAQGTPEDVAAAKDSYTGQFLKPMLAGGAAPQKKTGKKKAAAKKAAAKKPVSKKKAKPKRSATLS